MIFVLNYGAGLVSAVLNMIRKAGGVAKPCSDFKDLDRASAIILPGVRAFDNVMTKLKVLNLQQIRRASARKKIPFLGICVGMQLLFQKRKR